MLKERVAVHQNISYNISVSTPRCYVRERLVVAPGQSPQGCWPVGNSRVPSVAATVQVGQGPPVRSEGSGHRSEPGDSWWSRPAGHESSIAAKGSHENNKGGSSPAASMSILPLGQKRQAGSSASSPSFWGLIKVEGPISHPITQAENLAPILPPSAPCSYIQPQAHQPLLSSPHATAWLTSLFAYLISNRTCAKVNPWFSPKSDSFPGLPWHSCLKFWNDFLTSGLLCFVFIILLFSFSGIICLQ